MESGTRSCDRAQNSARQHPGYAPYGYHCPLPGIMGFNGSRADPVTGHYPLGNGHRVFVPSLMRLSSPDRMSPFAAGGLNSYAYCLGDPVNRLDPSGNIPVFNSLKQFYRRLFPKIPALTAASSTQKNLPASIKSEQANTYTRSYTTNKYPMNIVENSSRVPRGYQLIGFHGTKKQHIASLESGLDIKYSKGGLAGRGLYITQYAELANNFTGPDGAILGVYVKDFSRWVEGTHYFRLHSQVMVIHERAYYAVRVRRDIQFPIVFSAAYANNPSDEPYGGRLWF